MSKRFTHVVGFDDAPFEPSYRGDVLVVGVIYSGLQFEGVISAKVRRDGANATRVIAGLVKGSRFFPQLHAVLLQGIAFAGFNVVDLAELNVALGMPVLIVSRRKPDLDAVRRALLENVSGGARKWRTIERAGPMEAMAGLYVQRAGLSLAEARALVERLRVRGKLPEPLRIAHLIAGGVTRGESSGRA
jgi:endonuclease V-like protein UPF0215 family